VRKKNGKKDAGELLNSAFQSSLAPFC